MKSKIMNILYIIAGIAVAIAIIVIVIQQRKIANDNYTLTKTIQRQLEKQNTELKQQNTDLLNKVGVIDRLVFKSKLILDDLKKKDSIGQKELKNVKGSFDKLNNSELKQQIDEEWKNDPRFTNATNSSTLGGSSDH